MDGQSRRGRKRKNSGRPVFVGHSYTPPGRCKPWSFLSSFFSLITMMSLMSLIYLMLEYHCTTCSSKCNINNLSKNIDDIANNLSIIKQNYQDLEVKISKFSLEIPKIEGQIDILETLANTLENRNLGWNPKTHLPLPNVDVYLSKNIDGRNVSKKCSNLYEKIETK